MPKQKRVTIFSVKILWGLEMFCFNYVNDSSLNIEF